MNYNSNLNPDDQIAMEEKIASAIFHEPGTAVENSNCRSLDEEDCANLGRTILLMVLQKFRPDLIETKNETPEIVGLINQNPEKFQELLDELVLDLKSQEATDINNGGYCAQLEYIAACGAYNDLATGIENLGF